MANHASQSTSGGGRKTALRAVLALLVCGVLAGCAYLGWQFFGGTFNTQQGGAPKQPLVETQKIKNPVDFVALQEESPEAYAWVYVPGTKVNYPVMRSKTDDLFYMDHDAQGNWNDGGSIFSQSMNSLDFEDPVTVLYGHNLMNGSMFATLHEFEDPDFFAKNQDLYIYAIGHVKKYQIVAAYQYDNKHIMNSYAFENEDVRRTYFDSVLHPTSVDVNVREGVELPLDSKLVQLSTCVNGFNTQIARYIVTAKLVDDQLTY